MNDSKRGSRPTGLVWLAVGLAFGGGLILALGSVMALPALVSVLGVAIFLTSIILVAIVVAVRRRRGGGTVSSSAKQGIRAGAKWGWFWLP